MSAQPVPPSQELRLHERALELLATSGAVAAVAAYALRTYGFVTRDELYQFALVIAALECGGEEESWQR